MIIVGVVGGIGSGKSAVCRWVADRDPSIRVIDADRDGHRALCLPDVQTRLRREFGPEIFDETGSVSRPALARLVFGDTPEAAASRQKLEAIVHPAIAGLREAQLEEFRRDPRVQVALIDAAILLEAGWQAHCQRVVFVDVTRDIRIKRVATRGWTEAELARREASQWPLEKKRLAADFVVDNSETLDNAGQQLYQYIRRLVASNGG